MRSQICGRNRTTQPGELTRKISLKTSYTISSVQDQMDLTTAQQAIANDWIATYKSVFHTDKPV